MNGINPDKMSSYVNKLKQKGYSDDILQQKMTIVRLFLEWAYDSDKIQYKKYQQLKDSIANVEGYTHDTNYIEESNGASDSESEQSQDSAFNPIREVSLDTVDNVKFGSDKAEISSDETNNSTTLVSSLPSLTKKRILSLLRSVPFLMDMIPDSERQIPKGSYIISENRRNPIGLIKDLNTVTSLNQIVGTQKIFGVALAGLLLLVFAVGLYGQFYKKNERIFAYSTKPITGTRTISFQGRLTDSLGNPISTTTNMRFRLYDASSAGITLYDSGTCSVDSDQHGIHNVLIGSDCGAEITNSVFTENNEVWLGVTVGNDSEMDPRQQIANVTYAVNSETLQGLRLGKGTSTIPYIDYEGNLLIATANPGIRSTYASATFALSSAHAIILQSAGAGDITLTATESGNLKFLGGGTQHMIIENGGDVGIGVDDPSTKLHVLATSEQLRLAYDMDSYTSFTVGSDSDLTIMPAESGQVVIRPTTDSATFFQVLDANGGTPILNIDAKNERVGIGTASPAAKLEVEVGSSGAVTGLLVHQDDPDQIGTRITNATNATATALDLDVNSISGDVVNLDWAGATNATGNVTGAYLDFTNLTPLNNNSYYTYGVHINDPTANNNSHAYGIYVEGTHWDYGIYSTGSIYTAGDLAVNGDGSSFAGGVTFNDDVDMTFAGTENLAITSDLAGTVNVLSIIGTPSSITGTTRGIYVQQASSAHTNGIDTGIEIQNSDETAMTEGIKLSGIFTDLIKADTFSVNGEGNVSAAKGLFSGVISANNATGAAYNTFGASMASYASSADDVYIAGTLETGNAIYATLATTSSLTGYSTLVQNNTTNEFRRYTSSLRYKDDIQSFSDDPYKILSAVPKEWQDAGGEGYGFGFIAEEFDAQGLNNLVVYDAQNRPDGLSYNLIPVYMLPILKDHNVYIEHEKSVLDIAQAPADIPTLTVNNQGNVGIGTTQPEAKFHVKGDTKIDGNMNVSGDVAVDGNLTTENISMKGIISSGSQTINALPDQGSLVPNAGFEADSDSTGLPDNWEGQGVKETTHIHQGSLALKLENNEQTVSTCVPVSGGQPYSLRISAKSPFPKDNLTIGLTTYHNKNDCLASLNFEKIFAQQNITITDTYMQYGDNMTVGDNARWARVFIHNSNIADVTSTLYADGVQLQSSRLQAGLDLAETYPVDPLAQDKPQIAELVSMGKRAVESSDIPGVIKTNGAYDENLIGVISTQPGLVLDDDTSYTKVNVALKGRVPVLVTTESGSIRVGDPITSSSILGVGMKATKPGKIVGYAMTEWTSEDPKEIDQVIVFVNPGYNDPYATKFAFNIYEKVQEVFSQIQLFTARLSGQDDKIAQLEAKIKDLVMFQDMKSGAASQTDNDSYRIHSDDSDAINNDSSSNNNIASTSDSANFIYSGGLSNNPLSAGRLEAVTSLFSDAREVVMDDGTTFINFGKGLTAQVVKFGTATIDTLIVDRIVGTNIETQALNAQKITTKTISTESINTKDITSEKITSASLEAESATIAGILTADYVDAKNVDEIRERLEKIALNQSDIHVSSEELSADVKQVEKYINDLNGSELDTQSPETYQKVSDDIIIDPGTVPTSSGTSSSINYDSLVISENAYMYTATIADSLAAGNIFIKDNEIASLADELSLTALESVNILDGAVVIARDGSITARGEVIAQKGIRTNSLSTLEDGSDLTIQLGKRSPADTEMEGSSSARLSIKNSETEEEVASIDSDGSANFSEITVNRQFEADSNGVIIAAADNYTRNGILAPAIETNAERTGTAILPAGNKNILIYNDKIKDNSLIYITATSSTDNKSLYVARKYSCSDTSESSSSDDECKPYFKVSLDDTVQTDVTFNWWIVN